MIAASLCLALAPALAGETVALKAGTIHLVEGGQVLEGGATVLIEDGKIIAVGKNVELPRGARVVDYGEGAVLVPGLVAGDSSYGRPIPSERAAEPGLLAIDHFDPYSDLYTALMGGVTSTYIAPARGRLIAGQGAVVKTWGKPQNESRVVSASTGLHGSISVEARETPGYWKPPVPATVDVGLGVEEPQLPRSTMGAIVALDELLRLARGEDGLLQHAPGSAGSQAFGESVGPLLAELTGARVRWRMGAEEAGEVRALLELFDREDLPLVLDGGRGMPGAADLGAEIARAKVPVLIGPPSRGGEDFGKGEAAPWPRYDVASELAKAGVSIAITPGPSAPPADLRLAAQLARRGGLEREAALRAITLTPAQILGVADRIGSIAPGKDADLAVFTHHPLDPAATVLATWVGGEVAWKVDEDGPVVIEVEELHVGDGEVLRPGQLLLKDGRIVDVGSQVAHPAGATHVRGFAAMPGMIDARGHLGLEGSSKSFSTRTDLSRLAEPGDFTDKKVAQAGITTVHLASRSDPGKKGAPTLAYHPAASELDRLVVAAPCALHLVWSNAIRARAGEDVREVLKEAAEYKTKWEEYEKAMAAWSPPAAEDEAKGSEEGESGEEAEADDKADEGEDKKDEGKKKKDKDAGPRPVTGVWEGELTPPAAGANGEAGEDEAAEEDAEDAEDGEQDAAPAPATPAFLRLRLLEEEGALEGNLRCDALSSILVEIRGTRAEKTVELSGLGSRGFVELGLELDGDTLRGKVQIGGEEHDLELERKSSEYVVARRSVRPKAKEERPPRGMPRSPGVNPDLEPLRQAMLGKGAILVSVERSDEILECVEAFEARGIRPVLVGGSGAAAVAGKIRGKIAGVLPDSSWLAGASDSSAKPPRNRFADLQLAGLPIALSSQAEEGAVELPLLAAKAMSSGMSAMGALAALTSDAARMLGIDGRVGRLARGLDADVLLLDGPPLALSTRVLRVWVAGEEVR